MKINEILVEKKAWKDHIKRIKALPKDYQTVYYELQKYLYKTAPEEFQEGFELLVYVGELFATGVLEGKTVVEITGTDYANFCEELVKGYQADIK
ncbi:MAG: DUF1048 domain-containing protein [Mycoplasmatales bacterium]